MAGIPGTKERLGSHPSPKATLGGHHGNLSLHVGHPLATPPAREVGQSLRGNSPVSSKTLNPGQKEHEGVLMQYWDGLGYSSINSHFLLSVCYLVVTMVFSPSQESLITFIILI